VARFLRIAVMLRGHDISSPVDADRYAIVDLDKKALLGENQIRSRGPLRCWGLGLAPSS